VLVGVASHAGKQLAVYHEEKLITILQEQLKVPRSDAAEYFEFNILHTYHGEFTPIIVDDCQWLERF
jgi:hypothetical protein